MERASEALFALKQSPWSGGPLPGELVRLLQRPRDLLSSLEFPAQDFYPDGIPKQSDCSALMVN